MTVTKQVENLENSAVKLTATVSKQDVVDLYNENLKKYSKNIQEPGFRKGHVPANIIEKKYGVYLKQEVVADIIDKSLNEIFAEEDSKDIRPLPYSQPRLVDDKLPEFSIESDLVYSVLYDVFPKITVKEFGGITIKEPQVSIGDKELNEELKGLQERNAAVMDKKDGESVAKDDIVTINYKELNDDGSVIEGSEREDFVFTVGTGENIYKIDDEICGMKKDETKEISKTYDKNDSDPELAGKTKKISVTVKALKIRELPELDDDFAQDVNEKFNTLEDLKKDIMLNLEKAKNRKLAELKSQSLLTQLVEKNPVTVPKSMIDAENENRWYMMAQQFQTTPEQLDKMFLANGQTKEQILATWGVNSEKMLKEQLILDSLMREKNISATPEEVEAEYSKIADENGISVDEVKKHYEDPRQKEYIVEQVKENKLLEELYKQVKVTKGDKIEFADLFKNDRM